MVVSLATGVDHRASGALAFHVLEVLQGFVEIADGNDAFEMRSTCEKPRPLAPIIPIADFS
jgi:hypothetical protein